MTEPVVPDAEPVADTSVTQTTTDITSTIQTTGPPSWVHTYIRPFILCSVTLMTCWLAWIGVEQARSAIVATFISLASYLFAERAALKVPNKDS